MQQVFFVVNGDLEEVNEYLAQGGRVKQIVPVAEPMAAFGYAGGQNDFQAHEIVRGDVCCYIVVEADDA